MEKICPTCGGKFNAPPSEKRFCSQKAIMPDLTKSGRPFYRWLRQGSAAVLFGACLLLASYPALAISIPGGGADNIQPIFEYLHAKSIGVLVSENIDVFDEPGNNHSAHKWHSQGATFWHSSGGGDSGRDSPAKFVVVRRHWSGGYSVPVFHVHLDDFAPCASVIVDMEPYKCLSIVALKLWRWRQFGPLYTAQRIFVATHGEPTNNYQTIGEKSDGQFNALRFTNNRIDPVWSVLFGGLLVIAIGALLIFLGEQPQKKQRIGNQMASVLGGPIVFAGCLIAAYSVPIGRFLAHG